MPKLLLMRHAKSSWDGPGLTDFDRPLNARGRSAMPRVMKALMQAAIVPDRVICSTAQRARETLSLALERWNADMRIDMTRAIYEADASSLLDLARDCALNEAPQTLAIIGHNPALEDLAGMLVGVQSDQDALKRLAEKYPTAAVAVFEGGWNDLKTGGMRLERFIVPRDLAEA